MVLRLLMLMTLLCILKFQHQYERINNEKLHSKLNEILLVSIVMLGLFSNDDSVVSALNCPA